MTKGKRRRGKRKGKPKDQAADAAATPGDETTEVDEGWDGPGDDEPEDELAALPPPVLGGALPPPVVGKVPQVPVAPAGSEDAGEDEQDVEAEAGEDEEDVEAEAPEVETEAPELEAEAPEVEPEATEVPIAASGDDDEDFSEPDEDEREAHEDDADSEPPKDEDEDEAPLRREVIVPEGEDDGDEPGPPRAKTPPLAAALSRIDAAVGSAELVLVSIFLASLIGTAVYQFVASKVFKLNDNWPFEVIRYSVFFVAMSAAALAAQQKKMMAIDFVPRLMTPKTRAISRVLIGLGVVFVCALLFYGGIMVRDSIAKTTEHYDVIDPVLGVLALPIGAALIGFHFLIHAVIDVIYLASGTLPPEDEGISVH